MEIVFTSGTTGGPKGIEHTHANICAKLNFLSHESVSFQKYLRLVQPLRITGLEGLQDIQPPVIFAASHGIHMDTPALLTALPLFRRLRMAPTVRQNFFQPLVSPRQNSRLKRLSLRRPHS